MMIWSVTTLLFLFGFLENSRAINSILSANKDEQKSLSSTRNMGRMPKDVSTKVFFYLYTRCKPDAPCERTGIKQEILLNESGVLRRSHYIPTRPTKIVIHGFLNNEKWPMQQSIKDNLLKQEDVNVILVCWGKIAFGLNYFDIKNWTFDVGVRVAHLIDFLVENGARLDDIHIIGHSLGAHVAGFAGTFVKNGTVARITGLDPAKPGFERVPFEQRLNTNSAKFVDCIHTCGDMLGLSQAICHVDFYPNGGVDVQPGCPFFDTGICSHLRSFEYFAESINPKHKFLTESCPSVPTFSNSRCVPSTVEMGYYTPSSARGIFYGVTNRRPPFAKIVKD